MTGNYLDILETIYLVRLVPAWSANATTRAIVTPKVIFVDSGMAAHLTPGAPDDSTDGLLENFVLGELSRQLTWSRTSTRLYHYRDRDQYEVGGVLEDNAGQIVGIEVKAAETVRVDDFRGLRLLQRRVGSPSTSLTTSALGGRAVKPAPKSSPAFSNSVVGSARSCARSPEPPMRTSTSGG
ncbi:MAG: DUF4143 domain-containing protein [Pseudonocardiaceae bacterium]